MAPDIPEEDDFMSVRWNLDFEIAALALTIVMFLSYRPKRYLPLKRNIYFYLCIASEMIVILTDIAASITTSFHEVYPIWFLYMVNIAYFLAICVEDFFFYNYTVSISSHSTFKNPNTKLLLALPLIIVCVLVLTNPFTGIIFSIDSVNGYARQWGYYYILSPVFYFYILLSAIFLSHYHKDTIQAQLMAVYMACILTFTGAFLQIAFFPNALLINLFTSFGILLVYLSLQNPDYYRCIKSSCFNSKAFTDFMADYGHEDNAYSIYSFCLSHYTVFKGAYGADNMDILKHQIVLYLNTLFEDSLIFYLDDGVFSVVKRGNINPDEKTTILRERFNHPWSTGIDELQFEVYCSYIPEDLDKRHSHNLISLVRSSLDMAESHSQLDYIYVTHEMLLRQKRDSDIHQAIQKAIDHNSIQVYYQPIYDTKQKKIRSAEALARLIDDQIGFIPPDEFIVKAEQDGSIMQLGNQIFIKTLRFMREHKDIFRELDYLEINLSPVQCSSVNLADNFIMLARENNIELSKVNLEITETATSDMSLLQIQMHKLHKLGVTFSLDDYGTGFSNLTLILQLPLEAIKIDKSIVWAYFDGSNLMLKNIIKMFKESGYKIICEGIETKEMVDTLTEFGVDFLQGFYFSKPIPEEQFIQYVKDYNDL